MPTPNQRSNKADGKKRKEEESSRDNIGKVDMAHVEKAVEDDNGMFDGDVTVV